MRCGIWDVRFGILRLCDDFYGFYDLNDFYDLNGFNDLNDLND